MKNDNAKPVSIRVQPSLIQAVMAYRRQLIEDRGVSVSVSEAYRALLRSGLHSKGIEVANAD